MVLCFLYGGRAVIHYCVLWGFECHVFVSGLLDPHGRVWSAVFLGSTLAIPWEEKSAAAVYYIYYDIYKNLQCKFIGIFFGEHLAARAH